MKVVFYQQQKYIRIEEKYYRLYVIRKEIIWKFKLKMKQKKIIGK